MNNYATLSTCWSNIIQESFISPLKESDVYTNFSDLKTNNYNRVICPSTGRFGNQLLNIIFAIAICFENNIKYIKLPQKLLFYDKDYIKLGLSNNSSQKKNDIFLKNFWFYNIETFGLEKYMNETKSFLNKILNLPKPIYFNENILHIHIRSGDIMKKKELKMFQPPCVYYENEINRKKWEKVVIVSEDTVNPCIKYLTDKYNNVTYFGKNSLEDDIKELLSATNIMLGKGTFIPLLTLFMPYVQKINYPDDGDDYMHYFLEIYNPGKCVKHTGYNSYYDRIKKSGGWKYNRETKNLLLNFKN